MTLNGLCGGCGHYALSFKVRAFFGAHYEKLNEDIPILSATKCSLMTLVSGNIRFLCRYVGGAFPGEGATGRQPRHASSTGGLSEMAIFNAFAGFTFGTFRDRPTLLYSDMGASLALH